MELQSERATCAKCGKRFDPALEKCPHCGWQVPAGWVWPPATPEEEEAIAQKRKEARERIILTTGFEIEGRAISRYLAVVSSQEFLISDSPTQELEQATNNCLERLKDKAVKAGADAVIGVDIDYMKMEANAFMVVATGTAVRLQESE